MKANRTGRAAGHGAARTAAAVARMAAVAIFAAAVEFAAIGDAQAQAPGAVVYRCPGNPVLYTDTISAKDAKDRGCKAIEGAPITVIQMPKARSASPGTPVPQTAASPASSRIDPADQRARDSDARRILEAELRREEERLAAIKAEFNNGEPERQGNERNYQKYLDRVAELKAAIVRKEGDIIALRREITKHPQ